MPTSTLETKAHELLGQLGPNKLAAVVQLLEVMVHGEDEPVTEEEASLFREGKAWLADHGGKGIPMEDVLAEYGLTLDDFPLKT